MSRISLLVSLAATAASLLPTAAAADGVVTGSCVYTSGSSGAVSCVKIWRRGAGNPHITYMGPRSWDEKVESAERERLWVARCQPVLRQDDYGVRRYYYAAPGCEFGKYE